MAGTTSSIISNLLSSLERLSQFMPTFTSLAASSSSSIAQDVTTTKVNSNQERLMEDLSRLSRMLRRIQAFLHDAEQREINEKAIQLWLNELREVAYDAEDVLDQYDYQVIKAQLEGITTVVEAEPSLKRKQVDDDNIYGYQLAECSELKPDPNKDFDRPFGRVPFEKCFALVFNCPGMREWCQRHGFTYQDKESEFIRAMLEEDQDSDDNYCFNEDCDENSFLKVCNNNFFIGDY